MSRPVPTRALDSEFALEPEPEPIRSDGTTSAAAAVETEGVPVVAEAGVGRTPEGAKVLGGAVVGMAVGAGVLGAGVVGVTVEGLGVLGGAVGTIVGVAVGLGVAGTGVGVSVGVAVGGKGTAAAATTQQLCAQFTSIHDCDAPAHCPCDARVEQASFKSITKQVAKGRGAAVAIDDGPVGLGAHARSSLFAHANFWPLATHVALSDRRAGVVTSWHLSQQ